MKNRNNSGAALTFVAAATVVFMMITFAFFILSMQMGGSRELLHATDAGSLTVAREAIRKPDVPLTQQTEESLNFAGLLDKGQVSLANYNRIVGQVLLVSLNAQAEGTVDAKQHAELLMDVLQGSNGIGAKLRDALNNKDTMGSTFTNVSMVESVRMLGNDASAKSDNDNFESAYMEPGSSSNVDLDPRTVPFSSSTGKLVSLPADTTTSESSARKLNYISGYKAITFPGFSKSICGVPVMPGQAPHLVSQKDFNNHLAMPAGVAGAVPPNSFKNGGEASVMKGIACSLVGALNTQFTAAIPRGYILIDNGDATGFDGVLGSNDNIWAQELNNPVFIAPGPTATRAFTQNGALYQQWAAYNKAKALGQPLPAAPSTQGIFGDPNTITEAGMLQITSDNFGEQSADVQALIDRMNAAWPHKAEGVHFNSSSLMAVELYKAKVGEGFQKVGPAHVHDPSHPYYKQYIPAPNFPTGLKAFDHGQVYPGQNYIGHDGSLRELLTQCNANSVLQTITQRLHQIKPEATDAEIDAVLNTQAIGMGAHLVVFRGDDNKFHVTDRRNAPSWTSYSQTDGAKQTVSNTYNLINLSVNAPNDGGAPKYPFMHSSTAVGIDSATFTPSSGYRNLLGTLSFSNATSNNGGDGIFWDPN